MTIQCNRFWRRKTTWSSLDWTCSTPTKSSSMVEGLGLNLSLTLSSGTQLRKLHFRGMSLMMSLKCQRGGLPEDHQWPWAINIKKILGWMILTTSSPKSTSSLRRRRVSLSLIVLITPKRTLLSLPPTSLAKTIGRLKRKPKCSIRSWPIWRTKTKLTQVLWRLIGSGLRLAPRKNGEGLNPLLHRMKSWCKM